MSAEPGQHPEDREPARFDARAFVATLPTQPGVYRMYSAEGELLYVGKARRLRDRVGSYFAARPLAPKVAALVKRVARIEVTLVNSELEALLLESNLIKQHRPRYNIVLRDDKTFPYIVCTVTHPFPRLIYYRGPRLRGERQFGPYPDAGAARESLHLLQRVFRLRNCRDAFFAHRTRPCLQYQIGRCSAPCVGLITREAYAQDVGDAVRVLEGRNQELSALLEQRMEEAAAALNFEEAAHRRDQLREVQSLSASQVQSAERPTDTDAVAIVGEPGEYTICVLPVREGRSLGTISHFPGSALSEPGETLGAFLLQYYERSPAPPEVLVNLEVEAIDALAEGIARAGAALPGARAVPPTVRRPVRGLQRRWIELAEQNARAAADMRRQRGERVEQGLAVLAAALDLPGPPRRMECFDISHTGGEGTVAACVVAGPDGPIKREYRRYNIEGVTPGDDYGAMHEALRRHGAHLAAGDRERPDLLLIDGGAGQVGAALDALLEVGVEDLAVVGVSKGPDRRVGQERLHRAGRAEPIVLPADSPALQLIQRVRDEAHRFAITGHRRRRARRFKESVLEAVPGLGPARRRALLTHFGGLQGLQRAALADIEKVHGVGEVLARAIYDHLHPGAQ